MIVRPQPEILKQFRKSQKIDLSSGFAEGPGLTEAVSRGRKAPDTIKRAFASCLLARVGGSSF